MPTAHVDTICARATPPGTGAIAIVRLSGPQAIAIVDRCFRPHSSTQSLPQARSHSLIFGHLCDPAAAEPIDDILVAIMRGPHSYTGEDVVELNLHGSPAIVRRALRIFVSLGARLAEPGEFTRRAFENGQIDLTQAEAICDLITAQTQAAAAIALRQLEGQLTERIATTRERLVDLLAQIEAHLDFPDEDLGEEEGDRWLLMIHSAGDEIARLIAGGERGQLLREGARVVLVGKPNAGKSALFNRLLGKERAIVSEHPGTTRDSLESLVEVAGLPLTVIDTAGLRAAAGEIERLGIARTESEIHHASLVLVCVPGNEPWSDKDDSVWHLVADSNPMISLTKCDLPSELTAEGLNGRTGATVIPTSAVTGEGIEELVANIGHRLLEQTEAEDAGDPLVASERHLATLRLGLNALSGALHALSDPPALELVAADLREAVMALDQILGLELGDDVLDRIFSRFCIGK